MYRHGPSRRIPAAGASWWRRHGMYRHGPSRRIPAAGASWWRRHVMYRHGPSRARPAAGASWCLTIPVPDNSAPPASPGVALTLGELLELRPAARFEERGPGAEPLGSGRGGGGERRFGELVG